MIDEHGGIDEALAIVRDKAEIPAGETVALAIYPEPREWFEALFDDDALTGAATGVDLDAVDGFLRELATPKAWVKMPDIRVE